MAAREESARHRLFRRLEDVLGAEEAATLMEHLHPRHWDELATKADLAAAQAATKSDLAAAQAATKSEFAALRTELSLQLETTEHRVLGAIHQEMAGLVTSQTRTIVFALVAALAANGGVVLAAVRL